MGRGEKESAQTLPSNVDKTKLGVFWIVSTPQGSGWAINY